jgi:hypothetical protein
MPSFLRPFRWPRRWLLWIAAGLVLRLVFILFPRPTDDDTLDYLQLGHNLLHHFIYGVGTGADTSPSLFRLPAYPIFLATFEQLFARFWPSSWFNAVFIAQVFADLATGLLLASFARRHLSPRAGEIALALAMLCPFIAAYSAIALTECLSIFAVALGVYAAGRALSAESVGSRDRVALILAGVAAALATLLRPDGILLAVALAFGIFLYTLRPSAAHNRRTPLRCAVGATSTFLLAALLPLVPWTLRNWEQFHVFQPLAPRYINDPGEPALTGVPSWLRTWAVEYVTTANVAWNIPGAPIDLADLPPRVFDSPQERAQTLALIADYNRTLSLSPSLDSRFAVLAAERIRTHPLRFYIGLPSLRVADMLLRPRTQAFYLDVFWWRWNDHPGQTICAILLGIINLFYVAAAAWAFFRGRVPWGWMLGAYLGLRFLLLATVQNPEPRYTLECFPILIIAAAAALSRSQLRAPQLQTPRRLSPSESVVRQSTTDCLSDAMRSLSSGVNLRSGSGFLSGSFSS